MEKIIDPEKIREIMNRPEHAAALNELFRANGKGSYPDYLLMVGDVVIVYGHN